MAIFSSLTELGAMLADKAGAGFQSFQNTVMPSTRPANTNTFSMDFSGMFSKAKDFLTSGPVGLGATSSLSVQAPKKDSGLFDGWLSTGLNLAKDAGTVYAQNWINNLRNSNKNSNPAQIATTPENPVPSQNTGYTVSDLLSLLNAGKSVANTAENVTEAAAKASAMSVYLVAGIGLLLVYQLSRGK